MSKKIYLFSLVLLALTFTACSETEEAGRYDNWQARSEAFIDSIANVYNSAENKALPDNDPEKLHAYKDPTIIKCCTLRRLVRMKIAVRKNHYILLR